MVRFKFALVVSTMLVLLFSSAATAAADRDARDQNGDDNPCCVIRP